MRYALPLRLALAAALLPVAPLAAQMGQPVMEVAPGNTLLTVSAEGRTFAEPDLAVFTAGVTTQGTDAGEALEANARAMSRVIDSLKRAGIAERDIQTSNLSLNPIYRDPNEEAMRVARTTGQPYMPPPPELQVPQIIGYSATNSVSVRQRDLEDYGKVIDTLVEAGANQVNGPMFQLDDQEAALDEARLAAMATARQRAELYAGAAGLRIVRALSISEGGGYYGPPPVMFAQRITVTGAPAAPPPPPSPVQPGELQMTANVTVLYELAP
jgi:uncharacterized protein YggE